MFAAYSFQPINSPQQTKRMGTNMNREMEAANRSMSRQCYVGGRATHLMTVGWRERVVLNSL